MLLISHVNNNPLTFTFANVWNFRHLTWEKFHISYIFWSFYSYKWISTEPFGKITFLNKKKKHVVLSRIRQYVDSERKLGVYFFPWHFKGGFQRVFEPILRGFQSVSTFLWVSKLFKVPGIAHPQKISGWIVLICRNFSVNERPVCRK